MCMWISLEDIKGDIFQEIQPIHHTLISSHIIDPSHYHSCLAGVVFLIKIRKTLSAFLPVCSVVTRSVHDSITFAE